MVFCYIKNDVQLDTTTPPLLSILLNRQVFGLLRLALVDLLEHGALSKPCRERHSERVVPYCQQSQSLWDHGSSLCVSSYIGEIFLKDRLTVFANSSKARNFFSRNSGVMSLAGL